ncbi:MAG: AbrB/MazE/SpoVT family DNA-binding domain-containing protein [Alphaproteobacteria bacterium]|nr:AbrB/MazE/SpoVT family DNA-binding domain-containing protein [Alphaproteobacteria bacterium]
MSVAVVGRWGKSLAVRLPGEIAGELGIRDGERVQVDTHEGAIVIRRAEPEPTLEELFAGRTAAAWRAEFAGALDRGGDVGREIVDE